MVVSKKIRRKEEWAGRKAVIGNSKDWRKQIEEYEVGPETDRKKTKNKKKVPCRVVFCFNNISIAIFNRVK